MREKEEWLKSEGFELYPDLACYRFYYHDGDYRAGINFTIYEIASAELEWLKFCFEEFLMKAKNKETF